LKAPKVNETGTSRFSEASVLLFEIANIEISIHPVEQSVRMKRSVVVTGLKPGGKA